MAAIGATSPLAAVGRRTGIHPERTPSAGIKRLILSGGTNHTLDTRFGERLSTRNRPSASRKHSGSPLR